MALGMVLKIFCLAALSGATLLAQPAIAPMDDSATSLESLLATKVVTASRFSENLADAPGVMRVVKRDEIDRFGGLTLREILSRVAGLDWTASNFTDRSMIASRGDQAEVEATRIIRKRESSMGTRTSIIAMPPCPRRGSRRVPCGGNGRLYLEAHRRPRLLIELHASSPATR